MIADSFFTDASGDATISGKKSLPGGMYTIYFPNQMRLDLLMDKDQDFTVTTDTADMVEEYEIQRVGGKYRFLPIPELPVGKTGGDQTL